jgi:hypothetical protein
MQPAFLVWEPGAALLFGLLLSRERKNVTQLRSSLTLDETPGFVRKRGLLIAAVVFFASVLAYLGFFIPPTVKRLHREAAYKRFLAEAPSVVGLPDTTPISPEQALVVQEVNGLYPRGPARFLRVAHRIGPRSPVSLLYSIGYSITREPSPTAQRIVTVEVAQWPNAEWARYDAKYPFPDRGWGDSPHLTRVKEFGNTIVQNSQMRYPNGDGTLCFLWPSERFVVTVCYETRQVNEEMLGQYLAKYPSSL